MISEGSWKSPDAMIIRSGCFPDMNFDPRTKKSTSISILSEMESVQCSQLQMLLGTPSLGA